MYHFLAHFIDKLCICLSTGYGWFAGAGLIILNCLVAHKVTITLVIAVVIMDLVWGIASSVKRKQFTTSELMRDTVSKFAVYGTAILTFCFIDRIMGESFTITTAVISALIILVELWSSFANALIVFPRMPFLRLMLPALEGEIANKMHTTPDKVHEAFTFIQNKKKQAKS